MTTQDNDRRSGKRPIVRRHGLFTRVWHWVNAVCLLVLLMSGLQIFNAHPALYWGQGSDFSSPALAIGAMRSADGQPIGVTKIYGHDFNTTGVLGLSTFDGQLTPRAFPAWATLPGSQWLSAGRKWHFTAAWLFGVMLVAYLVYSLISRSRRRLLTPTLADIRGLPRAVLDHVKLRFDHGRHYNAIQKLTYLGVLFVLLPLVVLTGLTMSPTMDAAWPWMLTVFGGHQSARTIHFICAFLLTLFFLVHIALVLVSGVFNNMRSMITGGYRLKAEAAAVETTAEPAPTADHPDNPRA